MTAAGEATTFGERQTTFHAMMEIALKIAWGTRSLFWVYKDMPREVKKTALHTLKLYQKSACDLYAYMWIFCMISRRFAHCLN